MMTVKELRDILDEVPGDCPIWITLTDDETPVACVTRDGDFIRLCVSDEDISYSEKLLWKSAE